MKSSPPNTAWLTRARWGVAVGALTCTGVGLFWVYRSAMAQDVGGAIAGAGLCLGVLALDLAAAAVLRLGGLIVRSTHRLDTLQNQLSALEVAMDAWETSFAQQVDLTQVNPADADALVAARLPDGVFPRLVSPVLVDAAEGQQAAATSAKSAAAGQEQLDELVRRELVGLRREFSAQVREGDYSNALTTGERIEALFPDSDLARQFKVIRRYLERRIGDEDDDAKPASAG